MSYEALYRRWRPRIFDDIIGQEPIIKTLENQIKSNQISHAYLFVGTRGTGKTSTAKVLSKAVNCSDRNGLNPCNQCSLCRGIDDESLMDVVEIDAASNNGVENIREIRENVKYHPSKAKYKVYIIDEVHMLSKGAFNALLKTLEEPPSYVIFILATTEPRKIPATILSRCQRFDFKPVKLNDIIDRLSLILNDMNIKYDDKALNIIGIAANGGVRDSLSILEQIITREDKELRENEVRKILGIVSKEFIGNFINSIMRKDILEILKTIEQIDSEGIDFQEFIADVIEYTKNILLFKMGVKEEKIYNYFDEDILRIEDVANKLERDTLVHYIKSLTEIITNIKYSNRPRLDLEVGIISFINNFDFSIENNKSDDIKSVNNKAGNTKLEENLISKNQIDTQVKDNKKTSLEKSADEVNNSLKKEMNLSKIHENWDNILEELKKKRKVQIQAMLKEGELLSDSNGAIVIGFKPGFEFHRQSLDRDVKKDIIKEIIKRITGQVVDIKFIMKEEEDKKKDDIEDLLKSKVPKEILQIED